MEYFISDFSNSVIGNSSVIVPLGQIYWRDSWLFFLTPYKQYASKSCCFYPPNIFIIQSFLHILIFPSLAQAPSSLSWIITVAFLSPLHPYIPRVCALCSSCRDPVNTEVRAHHPSANTPLRAFCAPFKTKNFITTSKALFFSCNLFSLLCLPSLISLISHYIYKAIQNSNSTTCWLQNHRQDT